MNQVATQNQEQRLPTTSVGFSSANGTKIAPQNLGEIVRFAEVMSKADVALPQHLRGNPGACMAVAMQALEWQMSPFAVASKSYVVKGAVAYEAQLIAAVVNTRSGIQGRLKYRYDGNGDNLTCTVSGVLDGETYEYTSPTIGSIQTKNSPLWKSDPQQQLGYFAARSWARRYVPEVLLGVYDREEAQSFQGADNAKNVTPVQTITDPFGDEPQSATVEEAEIVTAFTQTPASAPDTQDTTASDSVTSSASEPEGGEGSVNGSTLDNSEEQQPDFKLRNECWEKFRNTATDESLSLEERRGILESSKDAWKLAMPDDLEFVRVAFMEADNIIKGKVTKEKATDHMSSFLGGE